MKNYNLQFRTIIISFFILLGFFSFAQVSQAADLHVGTGQTYSTIMAAMNVAVPGDRIIVHAGVYNEMVDFNKNNITLTRYETDVVTITGGTNTRTIRFFGDNNKIEYVNLHSGANSRFVIAFASGADNNTVTNCDIRGGLSTDKWIYASGANSITFTNNTFSGRATYDGPIFIGHGHSLIFKDNKLDYNSLVSGAGTVFFTEWLNEEAGTNYNFIERNYFYNIGTEVSVAAFMFRETDGTYFRNNIIEIDSDYGGQYGAIAQIRGMTDGGDSCDDFYFTNNTIKTNANHNIFLLFSDTPVNVKVTNNLIIGLINKFAENFSPLNLGSGNLIENNRTTDSSVVWASGLGFDWTVRNNYTGQSIVWNNSGNKPNPFYDLIQNLDGGDYSWNPIDDYNKDARAITPDVGAFEFEEVPTDTTPPAPPTGVTVS